MKLSSGIGLLIVTLEIATTTGAVSGAPKKNVRICLSAEANEIDGLAAIKRQASGIFREASVVLQWHKQDCPEGAIRITL